MNHEFDSFLLLAQLRDDTERALLEVPDHHKLEFLEWVLRSIKSRKKRLLKKSPTSDKGTHIYLMHNPNNGLYKIGKSKTPVFREKTLQAQEPEVELIFASKLTHGYVEKVLHIYFDAQRVRGEWFRLTDEDIEFVINYNYETTISTSDQLN